MTLFLRKLISLVVFCFFIAINAYSSFDSRYGTPYVYSYTPEDYPGEGQCFEIAITSQNMIYVANGDGLLEYDGVNWRQIPNTEGTLFTSVAVDSLDRVWTGGLNGAGVLIPDSLGSLVYHSITTTLDDSLNNLGRVWRIMPTPDGVYFQSPKLLVRWDADKNNPLKGDVKRWPSKRGYTMTRLVGDRLFVKRSLIDLEEMVNDSLVIVRVTEPIEKLTFADCVKFDENSYLLASYRSKLVYFDDSSWHFFDGEINSLLDETITLGLVKLDENRFALSCSPVGLIVFNKEGDVLDIVNTNKGFTSNGINRRGVFDKDGLLWVPLDYGIGCVDLVHPIRIFDDRHDITGSIITVKQFNNRIFAGTSTGLYTIDFKKQNIETNKFSLEKDFEYSIWWLENAKDNLIIGSVLGLYVLNEKNEADLISPNESNIVSMTISPDCMNIFYVMELQGIFLNSYNGRNFEFKDKLESPFNDISSLLFGSGYLWATVKTNFGHQLWRSPYDPEHPDVTDFEQVDSKYGLPHGVRTDLQRFNDLLVIDTQDGLYCFNTHNDRFQPSKDYFGRQIKYDTGISKLIAIDEDRCFFTAGPEGHYVLNIDQNTNSSTIKPIFNHLKIRRFFSVGIVENSNILALGTDDGRLILYDTCEEPPPSKQPIVLIRNIRNSHGDVILSGPNETTKAPKFGWENNSLRFEYALTSHLTTVLNEYQYRLLGLTHEWSLWSGEPYKDFNNLNPGKYTFEVIGKNADSILSEKKSFSFIVLPPWYRTTFSYFIWGLLILLGMYGFIKYRLQRLEKQKKVLEGLILDRTRQLYDIQQKELKEINARKSAEIETQRLVTATKLATAVSHEFNNPLAIIQGRVELMCQIHKNESDKKHQESILNQIERMKKLVMQLQNINQLPEVDYIEGIKMLDLHNLSDNQEAEEKE